jgi:PAS domain S-box-containing protein
VFVNIKKANAERYESRLIRVQGIITNKWEDAYGSYLALRDNFQSPDSITIFLIFRHQPGIDFKKYDIGNHVMITGILGQFSHGGALNTGYEIFPRYPNDIQYIETSAHSYLIAIYISIGSLLLVLVWVLMLRRQVAHRTRDLRDSENRFRSIFEGTNDAILVLQNNLQIESANPAACQLCGINHAQLTQRKLTDLFSSDQIRTFVGLSETEREKSAFECELTMTSEDKKNTHLLAKMNVYHSGNLQRIVLVLRDITERKKADREREELVDKLTDALAEVRVLGGLLPICSSCKKIRDDKGYWKQLEEYFHSHSDVRFSHGMCPDCFKEFYPNFGKKE